MRQAGASFLCRSCLALRVEPPYGINCRCRKYRMPPLSHPPANPPSFSTKWTVGWARKDPAADDLYGTETPLRNCPTEKMWGLSKNAVTVPWGEIKVEWSTLNFNLPARECTPDVCQSSRSH